MSGTRSPFRTEQATDRQALIVAHGNPSDPAPQEAALSRLAAQVAKQLPGWGLRGATLAKAGFQGPVLPPLISYPGLVGLIAKALRAAIRKGDAA